MTDFKPGDHVYLKTELEVLADGFAEDFSDQPGEFEVISVHPAPTPVGVPYAMVAEPPFAAIDVPLDRLVHAG